MILGGIINIPNGTNPNEVMTIRGETVSNSI
jgi:hypothetical protein